MGSRFRGRGQTAPMMAVFALMTSEGQRPGQQRTKDCKMGIVQMATKGETMTMIERIKK